jgi:hypothetical protein
MNIKSSVAVVSFLPGQAKDLSALLYCRKHLGNLHGSSYDAVEVSDGNVIASR